MYLVEPNIQSNSQMYSGGYQWEKGADADAIKEALKAINYELDSGMPKVDVSKTNILCITPDATKPDATEHRPKKFPCRVTKASYDIHDEVYSSQDGIEDATEYANILDELGVLNMQLTGIGGGAAYLPSMKAKQVVTEVLISKRAVCIILTHQKICRAYKVVKNMRTGSKIITEYYDTLPNSKYTAYELTIMNTK